MIEKLSAGQIKDSGRRVCSALGGKAVASALARENVWYEVTDKLFELIVRTCPDHLPQLLSKLKNLDHSRQRGVIEKAKRMHAFLTAMSSSSSIGSSSLEFTAKGILTRASELESLVSAMRPNQLKRASGNADAA